MPASPMTYAVPSGRCSLRNLAVASAEVQMADSGRSMPATRSRAHRSRGVKIELLVRTRNLAPVSVRRAMKSAAPGIAFSSCTRTPSMSVSHVSIGLVMPLLSTSRVLFEESPDQGAGVDLLRHDTGDVPRRGRLAPRPAMAAVVDDVHVDVGALATGVPGEVADVLGHRRRGTGGGTPVVLSPARHDVVDRRERSD